MNTRATLGGGSRMLAALLAVTLLGLPSTADAALGAADPETAPTICSGAVLAAHLTELGDTRYVRIEVPQGATVSWTARGKARTDDQDTGFAVRWGLKRADSLATVKQTSRSYTWTETPFARSWGPVHNNGWTNNSGETTEFLGFAVADQAINKSEEEDEWWRPIIQYQVTVPGTECSSLPDEADTVAGLGEREDHGYSADPVNTGTGNFVHKAVDLDVEGPSGGLPFVRFYNSMDDLVERDLVSGRTGVLGEGWTTTVDASLRPMLLNESETDLEYRRADGARVVIPVDGPGVWDPPPELFAEVTEETLADLGEVRRLSFAWGASMVFDLDGRLLRTEDGGRQRTNVIRDPATTVPTMVVSEAREGTDWVTGSWYELFDDDDNGLIDRIADPSGAQRVYRYEQDRLVEISVAHLPAEYPGGDAPPAEMFELDSLGRVAELHQVVDPQADPVETVAEAVNEYDAFGRVASQVMANGEVADFAYGPLDTVAGTRSTTVTHSWPEQPGVPDEVIVYVHDDEARLIGMVDSTPAQSAWQQSWERDLRRDRSTRRAASHGYFHDDHGRLAQRATADPVTGEIGSRDPVTGQFSAPGAGEGWGLETIEYCDATPGDIRVRRVTDPTGRALEFSYAPGGVGASCPVDSEVPTRITVAPGTSDETVSDLVVVDGLVVQSIDGDGVTVAYHHGDAAPEFGTCPARRLCAVVTAPGSPDEVARSFQYDAAGRVASITEAAGTAWAATTSYVYDAAGRLVAESGPLVGAEAGYHPIEYAYDHAGRLVCVSDESNATPASACDVATGSRFYTYDAAGRQVSTQDADGVVTHTEYVSAVEERVTVGWGTDDAATTVYRYGPLQSVTDPVGVVSQFCYDADGNLTKRLEGVDTDGGGVPQLVDCGEPPSSVLVHVTEFDLLGRQVAATDPAGVRTETRYDTAGRVTHQVTAAGTAAESVTETRYDAAGRVWQSLVPPPNVESFNWWDTGLDAQKLVTERSYTAGGRLGSVTVPNPNRPVVDTNPQLAGLVWSDTVTTTFDYDDAGRLVETWSPLASLDPNDDHGPEVRTYDVAGRLASVTSPAGRETRYGYDVLGRQTVVDRDAGDDDRLVTSTAYDPLGRVTHRSIPHDDPQADPTAIAGVQQAWSAGGRLESVWDPVHGRVDYSYDGRSNRTERRGYSTPDPTRVADPATLGVASVQGWELDGAGRMVASWRENPADLGARLMESTRSYRPPGDPHAGRLDVITDGSGRAETTDYTSGRVTERTFTHGAESYSLSYGYDVAGRADSVTDSTAPTAPLSRVFDVVGNLVEVDHPTGGVQEWVWGTSGNVMGREHTQSEEFFYDLDGRLAHSWATEGFLYLNVGSWRYDPDGLVTEDTYLEAHWGVPANPISYLGRQYGRDDGGRVDTYLQGVANLDTAVFEHVVYAELDYDVHGRLAREYEQVGHQASEGFQVTFLRDDTYGYDDAGQLRSVTATGTENELVSWDYDTLGRRTQATVTAEGAGRVPGPAGTVDYVYDPVGQLATIDHPSGPDTTVAYDDAGRRTTMTTGDVVVDYGWDPAGDLVARTETDDTTTVFDEARSYDPAGHLTEITTTTGTDITTDKMWWDPTWGVPTLSGWEHTPDSEPTVTYKFGAGPDGRPRIDDQAGNMWVLDVRGSHIDHYGATQDHTIAYADHYTWWGEATDPANGGDHTDTQPGLGYRGEVHTHDLIHLRHRDYDPTTGLFLSPDPLDGVDGTTTVTNPWHYTDNNPLNQVDPLGLSPTDDAFDLTFDPAFDPTFDPDFHPGLACATVVKTSKGGSTPKQQISAGTCLYAVGLYLTLLAVGVHSSSKPGIDSLTSTGTVPDPNREVECAAPQTTGSDECESGLLYRGGSRTQEALTPRPGNDTVGWPNNGLSTYSVKARACARSTKVQVLSPAFLATVPGLQFAPDPGDPSHIFLQGNSEALHEEWAASRDSNVSSEHPLTTGVRSSILRTEPC